ncbi:MAG: response regulator [Holosporales bacterium]|jgi:signal transduction histidine kinase|nr:response regulator [Holosporales bacterium]
MVVGTPTQASFDRTQARILIVDDQEMNRMILERRLRMDHFSAITQTADGQEALKLLESALFDVILLDMVMPNIGGYDVLCAVKQNPDLQDIPVIMISAEDDFNKIVQCIQAGAEDYLGKPFNPTLLRARLNASLDKKFLRDKEKRYQEQILAQQKLASLGALTEGIAHELKNPLHFVTNFAEISIELANEIVQYAVQIKEAQDIEENRKNQTKALSISEIQEDLVKKVKILETNVSKIVEHSKRADNIIRFMLDHSRTSGGKFQTGDINKLLEECMTMVFAAHKSQYTIFNVEIQKIFDKNIPKIELIWQDITHVLMNVIDNALYATCIKAEHLTKQKSKKTERGKPCVLMSFYMPRVILSSVDKETTIDITIKDNGIGISKENLKKICDPFFTTKPSGDGTGLGLSMVHEIIQEHKGSYLIDSVEGEWTSFQIILPKKQ